MADKKIHIVFTVCSDIDNDVDTFVDPIGAYDNLGGAAVLAGKIQRREIIEGIDYTCLGDFTNAVVISLPINDHIRHDQ
jgi:hypothetical protein